MTPWPKFTSLDEWTDGSGRKNFIVENPSHCRDWTHLLSKQVLINDQPFVVTGVERKGSPPWHKGEHIGLRVQ